MGYTKIIQYGDITEIYEYQNPLSKKRQKTQSAIQRNRTKQIRFERQRKHVYQRSSQSIKRSRDSFFRLCHHNNVLSTTINFFTLTYAYDITYKKASRYNARFMEKIKRSLTQIPFNYISVPERTKKGRLHFHLLVYNLPPETTECERETRNFQRLFQRGYIDIRLASNRSQAIAGYMAKYMAKALTDFNNETKRGYNCSRGIEKIRSYGSNTLNQHTDLIIPKGENLHKGLYHVPYLGLCVHKKIKSK